VLLLINFVVATEKSADIHVIVKIESADSIPNLQSILDAADGVGLQCCGLCFNLGIFLVVLYQSSEN